MTISEDKKQALLNKVQALLNLAAKNSGATEHEAASAYAMAQDLLKKYNLSLDDADIKNEKVLEQMIEFGMNQPVWLSALFNQVCRTFYCQPLKWGRGRFSLAGQITDINVCKFTFDYLRETIDRMAVRYANENKGLGHAKSIKASYSLGMVNTISAKLQMIKAERDAQENPEMTSKVNAMVLVKTNLVADYIKNTYGKLRNISSSVSYGKGSMESYSQGKEDGKHVNIAKSGLTSSHTSMKKLNG